MTIQSFTKEFQDYLFARNPIFHLLIEANNISHTDLYAVLKHTEELLKDFSDSPRFLEKETESIDKEVDTIFNSLFAKLDKINNYSEAMINLNSTFDDRYSIKNIHPYSLQTDTKEWNYIDNAIRLPGISTNIEIKHYKKLFDIQTKKSTFFFMLPLTTTYTSINISKKEISADVISLEYLGKSKSTIKKEFLSSNSNKLNIPVDIPLGTQIIVIETIDSLSENITITPDIFDYKEYHSISLQPFTYQYTDFFTIQTSTNIPANCYISVDLQLVFFDVNNKPLEIKHFSLALDNNGNNVDFYKNVKEYEEILYVYRDFTRFKVDPDIVIGENDIIIYKPVKDKDIFLTTEDTLKLNIRHAKSFKCIPTLSLYSLTNQKQTPKLYSMTGITKNESNK